MSKKYRIIGDIHGRHNWHNLIEPFDQDTTYIFVGDYTDPYYGYEPDVTYEGMLEEINYMFNFKREHSDNVVLLLGNHDMQYVTNKSETNRYDYTHGYELYQLFNNNKKLFSDIAYHIGNKYLITHAGVTEDWYIKNFGINANKTDLDIICNNINDLWKLHKNKFTFDENILKFSDYCGDSKTHSPVWIRPNSLWEYNIFGFESGIIQIVGHTTFESIVNFGDNGKIGTFGTSKRPMTIEEIEQGPDYWITDGNNNTCSMVENNNEHVDIIFIDCLRKESACIEIDNETLEWRKISI